MGLSRLNLQEHITNQRLTVCWRSGAQTSTRHLAVEPVAADSEEVVVWWYCSNCDEWHITISKPKDPLWLITAPKSRT